jgi:hypothetical protein
MPRETGRPEAWRDDIRGPAAQKVRAAIAGRAQQGNRAGSVEQIDHLTDHLR